MDIGSILVNQQFAVPVTLYDTENIRLRTDVDGGSLMDVGCYCVSGSRLLGGEPVDLLVHLAHLAGHVLLARATRSDQARGAQQDQAVRHCRRHARPGHGRRRRRATWVRRSTSELGENEGPKARPHTSLG